MRRKNTKDSKRSMKNPKAIKAKSRWNIWYVTVSSGSSSPRYDVIITTESDPVRLGCELPLIVCRRVTKEFNKMLKLYMLAGNNWFGDRKTIIKVNILLCRWRHTFNYREI